MSTALKLLQFFNLCSTRVRQNASRFFLYFGSCLVNVKNLLSLIKFWVKDVYFRDNCWSNSIVIHVYTRVSVSNNGKCWKFEKKISSTAVQALEILLCFGGYCWGSTLFRWIMLRYYFVIVINVEVLLCWLMLRFYFVSVVIVDVLLCLRWLMLRFYFVYDGLCWGSILFIG